MASAQQLFPNRPNLQQGYYTEIQRDVVEQMKLSNALCIPHPEQPYSWFQETKKGHFVLCTYGKSCQCIGCADYVSQENITSRMQRWCRARALKLRRRRKNSNMSSVERAKLLERRTERLAIEFATKLAIRQMSRRPTITQHHTEQCEPCEPCEPFDPDDYSFEFMGNENSENVHENNTNEPIILIPSPKPIEDIQNVKQLEIEIGDLFD